MKATGVVHLGNIKFFALIRENLSVVIFAIIFAVGVLISVLLYDNNHFIDASNYIVDIFNNMRSGFSFSKAFFTTYIFELTFLFSIFMFGTSLLGLAFIPFIVFIRGAFSGLLLCGLYSSLGLTGVTLNLLTLLPATIINVLTLVSGAGSGLNLSYSLCKTILNGGSLHSGLSIKFVLKKFGLLCLILIIGTLFEVFLLFAFKKFFV